MPRKRNLGPNSTEKLKERKTQRPTKSKSDVTQKDVDRLQKQDYSLEAAAEELGVAPSSIATAYYLAEVNNDPDLAIDGSDRAVAKGIVAQRKQGVRWVRLAARSGLSQATVKKIWEEETGIPPNETWTGRGAPPPGMTVEEAREIAAVVPASAARDDDEPAPKRGTAKRGSAKRSSAKAAPAKRSSAKATPAKRGAKAAPAKRGAKARTRAERLAKSGKDDPS